MCEVVIIVFHFPTIIFLENSISSVINQRKLSLITQKFMEYQLLKLVQLSSLFHLNKALNIIYFKFCSISLRDYKLMATICPQKAHPYMGQNVSITKLYGEINCFSFLREVFKVYFKPRHLEPSRNVKMSTI